MATVTGLTAAKALELAAQDIIDGEVSGDDLLLTRRNGDSFIAGNIRGPQGSPGTLSIAEKNASALPSTYSANAVTVFDVTAATGWPSAYSTVMTVNEGTSRIFQLVLSKIDGEMWIRVGSADVWGTFVKMGTKTYIDAGDASVLSTAFAADTTAIATAASAAAALYQPLVAAMPAPVSTITNGTVSASTTDTRDAILGNYVFTAIAGHSYRAVLDSCHGVGTVADDQFAFRIRNGGASTPTTASTAIAAGRFYVSQSTRAIPVPLAGLFTPGAGVQTLSVFYQRVGGTGTAYCWSADLARQLYVIDLGR